MVDFFTRLIERTWGTTPVVRPFIAPRFAPVSTITDVPAGPGIPQRRQSEGLESGTQGFMEGEIWSQRRESPRATVAEMLTPPEVEPPSEHSQQKGSPYPSRNHTRPVLQALEQGKTPAPSSVRGTSEEQKERLSPEEKRIGPQRPRQILGAKSKARSNGSSSMRRIGEDRARGPKVPPMEKGFAVSASTRQMSPGAQKSFPARSQTSAINQGREEMAPARVVESSDDLRGSIHNRERVGPSLAPPRPLVRESTRPVTAGHLRTAGPETAVESSIAATRGESSKPPTVRVTIGRVEVRALMPPKPYPTHPQPTRHDPDLSLDAYLDRRNRGDS